MTPRKALAAIAGVSIALSLAACGSSRGGGATGTTASGQNKGALVGISMPTQTDPGWKRDGDVAAAALKKAGYKVIVEYANNDVPTQVQQISSMLAKGSRL